MCPGGGDILDDLDPERIAAGRWRYATVRVLEPGAVVSPLAAPRARLRVADLLA